MSDARPGKLHEEWGPCVSRFDQSWCKCKQGACAHAQVRETSQSRKICMPAQQEGTWGTRWDTTPRAKAD